MFSAIEKAFEQHVRVLAKPGYVIVAEMTPNDAEMIHAAIGLVSETIEFRTAILNNDAENALEEAGDWLFYFTALAQTLRVQPQILPAYGDENLLLEVVNDVADYVKKIVIYRKDEPRIFTSLQMAANIMLGCMLSHGIELDRAFEHNVEKLKKRYPAGYTNEAAQARADKAGGL